MKREARIDIEVSVCRRCQRHTIDPDLDNRIDRRLRPISFSECDHTTELLTIELGDQEITQMVLNLGRLARRLERERSRLHPRA
jgi:hypothetical protein